MKGIDLYNNGVGGMKKAKAEIAGWCVVRIKKTGKVQPLRYTLRPQKYRAQAAYCHPDKRWKDRLPGIEVVRLYVIVIEKPHIRRGGN